MEFLDECILRENLSIEQLAKCRTELWSTNISRNALLYHLPLFQSNKTNDTKNDEQHGENHPLTSRPCPTTSLHGALILLPSRIPKSGSHFGAWIGFAVVQAMVVVVVILHEITSLAQFHFLPNPPPVVEFREWFDRDIRDIVIVVSDFPGRK